MMNEKDSTGAPKDEMARDWAGDAGVRWLAQLDRFESMIEPIGRALLAQADYAAGEKVVDIGCGGGWTTQQIAAAVGKNGLALGLDISADLIAAAQARTQEQTTPAERAMPGNIRFRQGDAAQTIPEEAPFDRLFSRFGVMFFTEPYQAFANLRKMLRDGGRLDMAVWAPLAANPWQHRIMGIIGQYIDLPASEPRAPGPFALSEQDYVTDLLQSAGFSQVEFSAWTGDQLIGGPGSSPQSAAQFELEGMGVGTLVESGGAELRASIQQEITELFTQNYDGDSVRMKAKAWLVSAVV